MKVTLYLLKSPDPRIRQHWLSEVRFGGEYWKLTILAMSTDQKGVSSRNPKRKMGMISWFVAS